MAEQTQDNYGTIYFLAGALIGGLAGAGISLLFAPQSGKATRDQILNKGIELRDEAALAADKAVAQVRLAGEHVSTGVQAGVEELKQTGQKMLDKQRERFSDALAADHDKVVVAP